MKLVSEEKFEELKGDLEAFKNETKRRIQMLANALAKIDEPKKKEEKPKAKKK